MTGENASPELSTDLVRRIHAGDDRAWEALYLRYRDRLLVSIRCRLGVRLRRRLESEDILHSVFKDVLGELEHFDPRGQGSLEHYLHVCALNKIRTKATYFAARKRAGDVALSRSLVDRLPNAADQPPAYCDAQRFERLERALAVLPLHLREVILLRSIEGLTNVEAAAVLDKTPEATSKLYNRAVTRIARLVDGWRDPGAGDA